MSGDEFRLWVDDEGPAPEGWFLVRHPEVAMEILRCTQVASVSVNAGRRDHLDLVWWLAGGTIHRGLPSSPRVEVRT